MLLMLYFLVFIAVLMCWVKFGLNIPFGSLPMQVFGIFQIIILN